MKASFANVSSGKFSVKCFRLVLLPTFYSEELTEFQENRPIVYQQAHTRDFTAVEFSEQSILVGVQ